MLPGAGGAGFHGAMPTSEPLVRVMRGGIEESVHRGVLVAVEDGRVTIRRGDPERVVYYRSSSKPLQALEVVLSGAADAYGFSPEELALAAGSHSGEPRHVAVARSILAKAGVPEDALRCGGHRSSNPEVAWEQRRDGIPVTSILSNCSGKHSAMLAAARFRGAPLDGYLDPKHPVQVAIRGHVALLGGIDAERVHAGIDGCGAPAFAVPMIAMARSIARVAAPHDVPEPHASAARRVVAAMLAHPDMVGGTDRFDTDLMRAAPGRIVAKAGAEGVHVVAVPERRFGMAVKVDDGSDRGYRAVVIEVLHRMGVLSDADADHVRQKHAPSLQKNLAGTPVGRIEVAF